MEVGFYQSKYIQIILFDYWKERDFPDFVPLLKTKEVPWIDWNPHNAKASRRREYPQRHVTRQRRATAKQGFSWIGSPP